MIFLSLYVFCESVTGTHSSEIGPETRVKSPILLAPSTNKEEKKVYFPKTKAPKSSENEVKTPVMPRGVILSREDPVMKINFQVFLRR